MANFSNTPEIRTVEFMNWLQSSVSRYARPDIASGRIQKDDVDDIRQDAYVHFMGKINQYDPSKGSWNCWRSKVLRCFYLDQKKKLAHHFYDDRLSCYYDDSESEVLSNCTSTSRTDAAVRTEEYAAIINKAFHVLTASERKVAEMKYSGYDKSEIKERLGMTGGSVDRHWCCAKSKIDSFVAAYYSI